MSKYPKVTIVVLNFNGLEYTTKCLKSLTQTKYSNFEIIVGDNGSDKNEAKILAKKFNSKKIHFIRFSKNLGFSGGNNKILRTIRNKYVVLLNNDVVVPPQWLSPLVKIMEKDKSIAVVQPKILWMRNKKFFDYAGASGGFIDILGYPFTRGRIFNTLEKDEGQYNSICDIFWASGAAMMIRTSVLEKTGLFDEIFFNYMEEIDLCFRIHQLGFRIICEPTSVIYHAGAATASKNSMQKRFWEHRNNLLLVLKNYQSKKLIHIFPQRILLEYVSFFYYLFTKQFAFSLAVLLSQISLLTLMPKIIWRKRKNHVDETEKMRKLTYQKSIVLSYFIQGRKKFHQLRIDYKQE
ncbi:MAG: glycosyltransferase family 2 protein [bacterium]|nr:glycosyltransferase family 2 protein [bacterium]